MRFWSRRRMLRAITVWVSFWKVVADTLAFAERTRRLVRGVVEIRVAERKGVEQAMHSPRDLRRRIHQHSYQRGIQTHLGRNSCDSRIGHCFWHQQPSKCNAGYDVDPCRCPGASRQPSCDRQEPGNRGV